LAVGALIAARTVPLFHEHGLLALFAFVYSVALGMSPFWYFQGTERMTKPVLLELAGRAMATGGIFLLVKSPGDGWKALALQAGAAVLTTAITVDWIYDAVAWRRPDIRQSLITLREGFGMFVLRTATSLSAGMNVFLLGLIAAPAIVGYYGGGERLASALMAMTAPISQAMYPHMSHLVASNRAKARDLVKLTIWLVGGLCGVAGVGAIVFAPLLVRLALGAAYGPSVTVLRILAIALPLRAVSNVLGLQWLVPSGKELVVDVVLLCTVVLNIALALLLARHWRETGMAVTVVLSEAAGVLGLSLAAHRLRKVSTQVMREHLGAPAGVDAGTMP
jgi:PST family polysaccharide transporter